MNHKKCKVVLILDNLVIGGAQRVVHQLATHLDLHQLNVTVICLYQEQHSILESSIQQLGIPIYYLELAKHKPFTRIVKMWSLLKRLQPDIIHTHLESVFYALPWAAAHRIPVLHTIHTQPDMEFSAFRRKVLDIFRRAGILHYAAISRINQELISQYYHMPLEKVYWINNPVELGKYYCAEDRPDEVTFISVGRLSEVKNHILAVRAMSQVLTSIPNAQLMIVGDGDYRELLEQEILHLGIQDHVCLYGATSEPEHLLAKANVYINTSHYEGLPLSILEGEASWLPVIAPRVGGIPDVVRDNGVLFEANDLDGLVREMIRFGTDPQLRERCGDISRAIALEYDADICARKYEALYQKLIN